ncbi:MAG: carboxymuconolactone decarboxylase family protein [Thermoplasmatota archaeon]
MNRSIEEQRKYREEMNDCILDKGGTNIKRFFALDGRVYDEGVLDRQTKELMGLVASTVLRCNDCIFYHIDQCYHLNVTEAALYESLSIALIVGGSITIPHIRYAVEQWERLCQNKQ